MQLRSYLKSLLVLHIINFAAVKAFAQPQPQPPTTQQQLIASLNALTGTADKICGVVVAAGESQSVKVSGDVKAQLGFLAKRLADLGLSGIGDFTSESYVGVLRTDLAATLKDQHECKERVLSRLSDLITKSGASQTSAVLTDPSLVYINPWADATISCTLSRQRGPGCDTKSLEDKKGLSNTLVLYLSNHGSGAALNAAITVVIKPMKIALSKSSERIASNTRPRFDFDVGQANPGLTEACVEYSNEAGERSWVLFGGVPEPANIVYGPRAIGLFKKIDDGKVNEGTTCQERSLIEISRQ